MLSRASADARRDTDASPPPWESAGPEGSDLAAAGRSDAGTRRRPIAAVRGSYGFFNRWVRAMDGCVVAVAALALSVDGAGAGPGAAPAALAAAVCAVVVVSGLHVAGAYRVEHYRMVRRSVLDLVGATAATLALLTLMRLHAPRAVAPMAVGVPALLAALLLERFVVRAQYRRLRRRGAFRRRVALVGDGAAADALTERLREADAAGELTLVGAFSAMSEATEARCGRPGVAELRRVAHEAHVDLIVLALPPSGADHVFETAAEVQWISADIVLPVDTSRFVPDHVVEVAGRDMLRLASHPLRGSQGLVKLVEDYVVALAALVVLSPLMLAAAALIRLEGGGPVLFRQRRMGVNGRPFDILKFRTMASDADDDGSLAVRRGDPRVSRVGAFLRRTSLDELPQVFNVLRGEMSIVGPRPHVAGMRVEGEIYSELVRTYAARHRIKPGITGWAQVNGMRAGITSAERARRGVELDLFYIRNWSLNLDLKIILLTLAANMIGPEVP